MFRLTAPLMVGVLLVATSAVAYAGEIAAPGQVHSVVPDGAKAPDVLAGGVYYRRAPLQTRQVVEKNWRGMIALYTWASHFTGSVFDEGNELEIDARYEDLVDILRYSAQGYVEVGYKRWSLAVDATFIGFGPEVIPSVVLVPELDVDQTLIDIRPGYTVFCRRIGVDSWGRCCYARKLEIDAHLGVRYWSFERSLELSLPEGGKREWSATRTWWDPYVGAKIRWPFAKRWSLTIYGDIGGFGIEDASDLTWEAQGIIKYHLTRNLYLGLGYRALYVDRLEGSGVTRDGVQATYHGPLIGLGWIF